MSEISAIRQNPLLGLLARALAEAEGGLEKLFPREEPAGTRQSVPSPFFPFSLPVPSNETLRDLTGLPGARRVAEDASYGFPPTMGEGFATKVDPAVLDLAGWIGGANKAHKVGTKLLEKAIEPAVEKMTKGPVGELSRAIAGVTDSPLSKVFAGPLAQDPPTSTYAAARKMAPRSEWFTAQDGSWSPSPKAEEAWRRYGWYRDPAGDWKWEIDDSKAKLVPDFGVERKPNGFLTPLYAGRGPLSTILEHDELYRQYPHLMNMEVEWAFAPQVSGVAYRNKLVAKGPDEASIKRTLLHEIQHEVQATEGFTKGADPEEFGRQLKTKTPTLSPRDTEQFSSAMYTNKLGEIEARAVEKRAHYPPAGRENTPPWKSFNTARVTQGPHGSAFRWDPEAKFARILLKGGLSNDQLRLP